MTAARGRRRSDPRQGRPSAPRQGELRPSAVHRPRGAVEDGESPLDAVVRETREETGAEVEIDHLVGAYALVGGLTVWLFRCIVADGEPHRPASDEIAEIGWFAPDDIPGPRSNLLHHALDDVVAGRRGLVRDGLPRIN